jgi:hypothetical protein
MYTGHGLTIHSEVISQLKYIITNSPVLVNFNLKKEISIQCNSSSSKLGCYLMQKGKPVEFFSRSLTDSEKQYSQIDKEIVNLLFSCCKFYNYIYGYCTKIWMDHLPLTSIYKKKFIKSYQIDYKK